MPRLAARSKTRPKEFLKDFRIIAVIWVVMILRPVELRDSQEDRSKKFSRTQRIRMQGIQIRCIGIEEE